MNEEQNNGSGKREEEKKQPKRWTVEALNRYRKYQKEYIKDNYVTYNLRLQREANADIIKELSELANRTNYIRRLIEDDLNGARKIDSFEKKKKAAAEDGDGPKETEKNEEGSEDVGKNKEG